MLYLLKIIICLFFKKKNSFFINCKTAEYKIVLISYRKSVYSYLKMSKDILTTIRLRYLIEHIKKVGFTNTSQQTLLLMDHSITLFFSHVLQILKNETLHAGRGRTTVLDIIKCKQFEKQRSWMISYVTQMRRKERSYQNRKQYISRHIPNYTDSDPDNNILMSKTHRKRFKPNENMAFGNNISNKQVFNENEHNQIDFDYAGVSERRISDSKGKRDTFNQTDHMFEQDEHKTHDEYHEMENETGQDGIRNKYNLDEGQREDDEYFDWNQLSGIQNCKTQKDFMIASPIDKYVHIYEHLPPFPASHTFRRTIVKKPIDFTCSNLKKRIEQSLRAENNLFKMDRGKTFINFLYHSEHDYE